ncbi:MAG: oxygen-independent coproporphyrinogen III oxidase [Planctomycetes bacterium]|nr:oxygen-independent coproporphyrinogen III oxidase [Planctomycetota bacterium]
MQPILNPGDITPDLIERLDRQGPRYTSYPTAPQWSEQFGVREFTDAIERADAVAQPLAIYTHIPFCKELCFFCGCNVVITNIPSRNRTYLDRVKKELAMLTPYLKHRRTLGQLHLGGGTPTHLTPAELEELHGMFTKEFTFTPDAELAIEVDPRVTSHEHIDTLARLGFNRISLGVQDFNITVQKAVNREQSEEQTKELFQHCRARGFRSINIDLMYGLPHQTTETFETTLRSVISMRPDRVAVFGYAHVPWMKKAQTKFERKDKLPEPRERYQLFATAISAFTASGYRNIGLDHFALPNDDLTVALDAGAMTRSFQGYTTRPAEDLLSLGHSSISDLGGVYAQNARALPDYESAVDGGRLATCRGYSLSADDLLRRHVIMKVMSATRMGFDEIEHKYNIRFSEYFAREIEELKQYESFGLLTIGTDSLTVSAVGRVFVRNLAMVFDRFLREKSGGEKRFSRTV